MGIPNSPWHYGHETCFLFTHTIMCVGVENIYKPPLQIVYSIIGFVNRILQTTHKLSLTIPIYYLSSIYIFVYHQTKTDTNRKAETIFILYIAKWKDFYSNVKTIKLKPLKMDRLNFHKLFPIYKTIWHFLFLCMRGYAKIIAF